MDRNIKDKKSCVRYVKRKWIGIICDDIMICFGACFVKLHST
jgi:hypothetical protein